ncbi:MAG: hypothetical protein P1U75_05815 [Antarcticimicrobium sp.]|uniref:hypothetical protein n=1 Tax=Antarcticimicrobium sp. TaxID=2824147 RepID=UPI002602D318|nr:hypothetical protein [Antarcticimicrobium sp.]MDF1716174.1 hypothetical protein [Antarcticimicrobium sp.]
MSEPLYISAEEVSANSRAFQEAVRKADELGVDLKHVKPEDAVVGHDKRRDPAAYREAKKCAEVLGTSVTFADPDGDANTEPAATSNANHLETEDTLYILSGQVSPRDYKRLTTNARSAHKRVVPLRSWLDAPEPIIDALKAHSAA